MRDMYLPPDTLKEALQRHAVPTLKEWASLLVHRPPAKKAELVSLICTRMSGDRIREVWALLTEAQRKVLAEAVHNMGEIDWTLVAAKYHVKPGETRDGLFHLFAPDGGGIPDDVRASLEPFVGPPARASVETTREVPEGALLFSGEQAAPLELEAVLRLVESGRLRVGEKTGRPSAATTKQVAEVLVGGDFFPPSWKPDKESKPIGPIRAFAWPILLQPGGLVHSIAGRLVLSKKGAEALKRPASRVIKGLWEGWLTAGFDEFSRVEAIKGQASHGGRHMTSPSERRWSISGALERVPVGEWVTVEAFERFLQASGFAFEVSENPWYLYIGDPEYGSLGYGGIPVWELVQRRYLLAFLVEYAATLGVIDLAYTYPTQASRDLLDDLWGVDDLPYLSRYDGLLQFRVNDLGAYCLGLAEHYTPTSPRPASRLRYAGDGVLQEEEMLAADRLFLGRFARKDAENRWIVTRDGLSASVEAGLDVAGLRTFLEGCLGDLPEDLDFLLSDVEGGSGRLSVVGTGTVVEVSSADLASRLSGDRTLQDLILLAGPRHLVILPGNDAKVRKRLRQLGFVLPRPEV